MGQDLGGREHALVLAGCQLAVGLARPTALQEIVELAAEVADARYASLVVIGAGGDVEHFRTAGVGEERRSLDRRHADLGVVGVVLREGRPVRRSGVVGDVSLAGLPRAIGPTSVLAVPIVIGEVRGALCLVGSRATEEFTEDDERALTFFAALAALALENARLLEQARLRQRALEGVNQMSQALLEGQDTDQVLRLVARWARELVGAALATVATPDEHGAIVLRAADGDGSDHIRGVVFPAGGSVTAEVVRTGRPLLVDDVSTADSRSQPMTVVGGIGPALYVPLAVGDRVFGTLAVGNPVGGTPFSDEDLLVVQTFAAEAAVALQHGQIRTDLERLALLEERERIAMELHDGVVQSLFVLGLSLQADEEVVDDRDAIRARLEEAVTSIDGTIRDLRDYIFGLEPGQLADRQLERSLRDLAEIFRRSGRVGTVVEVDPKAASLLAPRSVDVLQAAREAMSNAVRHGGGDIVRLRLVMEGTSVVLEVSDNGGGFDPSLAAGRGLGLANLRSRAEALGGTLELASRSGRGTTVRIAVPH